MRFSEFHKNRIDEAAGLPSAADVADALVKSSSDVKFIILTSKQDSASLDFSVGENNGTLEFEVSGRSLKVVIVDGDRERKKRFSVALSSDNPATLTAAFESAILAFYA
jgi:hypothetical protein